MPTSLIDFAWSRFINELQRKAARPNNVPVHEYQTITPGSSVELDQSSIIEPENEETFASSQGRSGTQRGGDSSTRGTSEEPALTNLLATDSSTFMTARNGMTFYLGTSSSWTFTQKVLSMVYERVFRNRIPDMCRNIEGLGNAYDLKWDGEPTSAGCSPVTIPAIDHSIYLINAVKFHCAQLYHMFDEDTFMSTFYAFYENPSDRDAIDKLWYVHFMVILAFGKGFTVRKHGKDAPGLEYFIQALQSLPNMIMLWRHPVHAVEVLTCIALYLHCLDYRIVALNYMGQAVRLALSYGLNTDIQADRFGNESVERIRRVWWTVYLLDREMASVAGLAQAVQSHDVYCQLPEFGGSVARTTALKMQLKLSHLIADINRNVYGVGGQLSRSFHHGIKSALADIAEAQKDLQQWFPLSPEQRSDGISRTSAHLHLEYHRCIILATRPLLFCFLKLRLDSREDCQSRLNGSKTSYSIIQMCLDSSVQILGMLESLLEQALIDPFLPSDLDSLSAATINVLVAMSIDADLIDNGSKWIMTAYAVFGDLIASGNQVARVRKGELDHLRKLLEELGTMSENNTWASSRDPGVQQQQQQLSPSSSSSSNSALTTRESATAYIAQDSSSFDPPFTLAGIDPGDPLTTADIMDLANSIDDMDTDWISQTIGHDRIW
ncbi:hypothetical protein PFICI_04659 [Pestalotiopsis fici W106-1]|uniref:Xylanolytic transcriptional activator regulatory domain-containing protein n=1 Tax=Pestalotiopsis fici (strain W106-1 / CGMCC3.15140) TaxID=1229662 RepID=W3X9K2_PESFW|nr:uncharacterized protein PFICI_04659 [Pestalotiopsis fici W106-1]ETS82783.1 hypothetical protein PFICI_04659 [Pestalotiopsis fici W106-1]